MKAKFSGDFEFIGIDPINGEHYRRNSDGHKVLVWWDKNTKLWVVFAINDAGAQISRDSEYVVRSDVPWAIENVDVDNAWIGQ